MLFFCFVTIIFALITCEPRVICANEISVIITNYHRSKGNKHILIHDKMPSIKYADEVAENPFFFSAFIQIQFRFLLEHIFQFSKFILFIDGWTWFPVFCQINIVVCLCANGQKGSVSESGDIQLNCNNDTMWLNTRQNVESHFPNKWMNLLCTVTKQKKNVAVTSHPSCTHSLTHSRDYLFIRTLFTVLMCWLYRLSHSNASLFFPVPLP